MMRQLVKLGNQRTVHVFRRGSIDRGHRILLDYCMEAFRQMSAVRPLAKSAVSGSFPRKLTAKDLTNPENTGFPGHGLIPVSFVFRGQYDAVWGLLPVEKTRRRRTQVAELGCSDNIHGCRQDACPVILPAENQGRGMRNSRMSAPCSDHDEAGDGNLPGFLDVFPAVPSKRLCGFHGYSDCEGISSPAASVWRTRRIVAGE